MLNNEKKNWLAVCEFPADAAPLVITGDLLDGNVGDNGTYQYVVSGGELPYGAITISGGALPFGATMDANGLITYDYTTTGSYTFTLSVTDKVGRLATLVDTLEIAEVLEPEPMYAFLANNNASNTLQVSYGQISEAGVYTNIATKNYGAYGVASKPYIQGVMTYADRVLALVPMDNNLTSGGGGIAALGNVGNGTLKETHRYKTSETIYNAYYSLARVGDTIFVWSEDTSLGTSLSITALTYNTATGFTQVGRLLSDTTSSAQAIRGMVAHGNYLIVSMGTSSTTSVLRAYTFAAGTFTLVHTSAPITHAFGFTVQMHSNGTTLYTGYGFNYTVDGAGFTQIGSGGIAIGRAAFDEAGNLINTAGSTVLQAYAPNMSVVGTLALATGNDGSVGMTYHNGKAYVPAPTGYAAARSGVYSWNGTTFARESGFILPSFAATSCAIFKVDTIPELPAPVFSDYVYVQAGGDPSKVVGLEDFGALTVLDSTALPVSNTNAVATTKDAVYTVYSNGAGTILKAYKRTGSSVSYLSDLPAPPAVSINSRAVSLAFSDDGIYLAAGVNDSNTIATCLTIYKRTGDSFASLGAVTLAPGPYPIIGDVEFSPDGKYLVACKGLTGAAPNIQIFKRTGDSFVLSQPAVFPPNNNSVTAKFSPDGTSLIVCTTGVGGSTRRAYLYTVDSGTDTFTYVGPLAHAGAGDAVGIGSKATFSPDGNILAVSKFGGGVSIWQKSGATYVASSFITTGGSPNALRFTSNGKHVLGVNSDARLVIYDFNTATSKISLQEVVTSFWAGSISMGAPTV